MTASGGAPVYVAADFGIDAAAGNGNEASLTLAKIDSSPTPGTHFSVNGSQKVTFYVTYTVAIEPLGFEGVMFGPRFNHHYGGLVSAGSGIARQRRRGHGVG